MSVSAILLMLSAGSASAVVEHPFVTSFGAFGSVQGIATDGAGDVYVYDAAAAAIYKFDAEGKPVNFAATGTNAISGVGGAGTDENEIAVDSSAGATKGDIYVANGAHIGIYGPDGTMLGELTEETPDPWGEPCGVAVDRSGNVYVGLYPGEVNKYVPKTNPVTNADYASSMGGLNGVCNVAADSTGNVFSDTWSSGPVTRYEASQFGSLSATGTVVDAGGSTLAVDPSNDELYIDEQSQISQFGAHGEPFGAPTTTFASTGAGSISSSFGVAVAPTSHNVYVSDGQGKVSVFGPLVLLPDVTVEDASNITAGGASVKGTVNPDGMPITECRFEYGRGIGYGQSVPCSPMPGAGSAPVEVSATFALSPDTYYHYRLAASNANGTNYTTDHTFMTEISVAPPVEGLRDTCPNAAFRVNGLSESLPDCRAYEMVSPLDKNGSDIGGRGDHTTWASVEGNRVAFIANAGFADTAGSGSVGATTYVASRGSSGWSTHAVTPPSPVTSYQELGKATTIFAFSSDLDSALVYGVQLPGADPGTGGLNLYREELASRALETATLDTSGQPVCISSYCWFGVTAGYASSDIGVVTFQTTEQMTPEATGGATTLYAWEHGSERIAGVMPDGTLPAGGSESVGGAGGLFTPAPVAQNESVSADGSRILFLSPADGSAPVQLYMRKSGTSTVWLSRSWTSTPNPQPEGVTFQAATPDETKVLFTSATPLLNSDPENAAVGLYLYTDTPDNAEREGKLSLIARLNAGGSVTAVSADGSHIYIDNPTPSPDLPERGEYLWDNGTLHHILNTPIPHGNIDYFPSNEVRISADGRRLGFVRAANLKTEPELAEPRPGQNVGSDPGNPGHGYRALYLYDQGSNTVTCASCPPSGAPMTASVDILPEPLLPGLLVPHGFPFSPRWLSSDGRFEFFSSKDALVPQDTNGLADVYEYDADTHEVKLLSSGTGDSASWFEDASTSGSDVFFLTQQKLSGWDTDTLTDLYDVRIDGGLPEPPPPAVPCDGDACQGIPSAAPSFNTASGFVGLGNQPQTQSAKAKKKKKPKRRKHLKRKHSKHGKHGRRTNRHGRHGSRRPGR